MELRHSEEFIAAQVYGTLVLLAKRGGELVMLEATANSFEVIV